MEFIETALKSVFLIKARRYEDKRGFFSETFKKKTFMAMTGHQGQFVQDNFSYSKRKGTVRGLHYQSPPKAQGKLVRCTRGKILDVAVDARKGSPTYGRHVCYELSFENGDQLWIPPGFLHGFSTLSDDSEVAYKCTEYYSPECDSAIIWNDPMLNIDWKINGEAFLSNKDASAQRFEDFISPF
ncbi:dTDP-4-dehydrorhamnose 3,5-epimerase [Litorimonas haliclonae]|uniref:dTDP-4-dehydrorhamnose 3,5-epimerase n=1 Tax=Litorimonas haliclonae TaxID=2081977 RepID=UPI0039EEFFAC